MAERETGLGSQVVRGTFWIAALEISNQGLQFIKTFFAARILSPADFGIVGIAFLIIAFMDIISTTGMKEAIIQRQDNVESYLGTVWLTELAKGVCVLLLTWFAAPLAATAFAAADGRLTTELFRFIGIFYFIQCCTNTGAIYFEKRMTFHTYFFFQFSGTLTDVAVSLWLVYVRHDVWALFYGVLAGAGVRVIFSFLLAKHFPTLRFNAHKARELMKYGKWILKNKIFAFLGLQSDSVLVTSFYPLASLGIYQMAFRIGNMPMAQAGNVIGRIAFTTFAALQDRKPQLSEYFLRAVRGLTAVMMPAVILIFCLIPEFTVLFLREKWLPIVPIVRILILSGFLRVLLSLTDSLFNAIGEPKESSNLQLYRFAAFVVLAAPFGYWFGISGIALSGLGSLLGVLIFYTRKCCVKIGILPRHAIAAAAWPAILAALTGVIVFTSKVWINGFSPAGFGALVLLALTAYGLLGFLLNKYTQVKIFDVVLLLLRKAKSQ